MQQRAPVIGVAIVGAVPGEMPLAIVVTWKREEKRRTIKPVLLAELRELFRSRLLAENRDSRVAGDEFDQQRNERDDGPNNEQENEYATQAAKDSMPMLGLQDRAILAENKDGKAEPCRTSGGEAEAKVSVGVEESNVGVLKNVAPG